MGIRTLSGMPHQISTLTQERKNMPEALTCDWTLEWKPQPLTDADMVDQPSDEDSDDEIDFELEIPPLRELVNEFEKDDE